MDLPDSLLLFAVGTCGTLHDFWHRSTSNDDWAQKIANNGDEEGGAFATADSVASSGKDTTGPPKSRRLTLRPVQQFFENREFYRLNDVEVEARFLGPASVLVLPPAC
jgi:hypothetical protein